jgi:RNA polymerase sigma factor (TIGR02999 family)
MPGPGASAVAPPGKITRLLRRVTPGDQATLNDLMDAVYPELRKLAHSHLRRERPGHVLQPTALANEAYIRLVAHRDQCWENRLHFFGAAARTMRRILVDYARAAQAAKRGGDQIAVPWVDGASMADAASLEMLALDTALTELQSVAPRQAQIVELRYFGGLSVPEIAQSLGVNPRTVDRDWAAARVWLRRRLRP